MTKPKGSVRFGDFDNDGVDELAAVIYEEASYWNVQLMLVDEITAETPLVEQHPITIPGSRHWFEQENRLLVGNFDDDQADEICIARAGRLKSKGWFCPGFLDSFSYICYP